MDPIRNPYAPGAGQRPPELAGRDRELQQFEVTLERIAAGRPDRSMILSGLRGVGKTVLLNSLRSQAVARAWGTGKIEGRADSGDLELDLVELLTDVAELGRDLSVGVALFVDEMQDIPAAELAALCGALHEISQQGA